MTNYLVVGRGWLGHKMVKELRSRNYDVKLVSHKDIFDEHLMRYDVVINCAGVTGVPNVDACENNPYETYQGNSLFPIKLYEFCRSSRWPHYMKFVHFSSGCIYKGNIEDVNADPNYFGSTYSISKGISDSYLRDKYNVMVVRIRMPFSGENKSKNLLTKLTNYAKHGKLYDSGLNSITDIDEAVSVSCKLLEQNYSGVVNLVNQGTITNKEIVELMGIDGEWYTEEEFKQNTVADRSVCTIPSHPLMGDVRERLKLAIKQHFNILEDTDG
jgi:nucleoside-diphosphate-sugar epimerase